MPSQSDSIRGRRLVFDQPHRVRSVSFDLDRSQLREQDVLLQTTHTLISPGTELALYTGTHIGISDPSNTFAKYPFMPGYSAVGRVIATGSGVTDLRIGDRVFSRAGHASHSVQPEGACSLLPSSLSDQCATFARMAEISMTALLQTQASLPIDSLIGVPVVVLGLGLVGNLAGQLFQLYGATVLAVDMVEERLQTAHSVGLHNTVTSLVSESRTSSVLTTSGAVAGNRPLVVIEATGAPELVQTALELVAPRGQVVLLGSTRGTVEIDVYKYVHSKGIFVAGAHEGLQGPTVPARDSILKYSLHLIERAHVSVAPLVSHELLADDARTGYELLLNHKNKSLGVILDWSDST